MRNFKFRYILPYLPYVGIIWIGLCSQVYWSRLQELYPGKYKNYLIAIFGSVQNMWMSAVINLLFTERLFPHL